MQQNGTWGITVGGTFYASQATSASVQGYQVLVLDRSWNTLSGANAYNPGSAATPNPYVPLTQVTNQFFPVPNDPKEGPAGLAAMATAVTKTPSFYGDACTGLGCYLVISSQGGMGFTSCQGKDSTAHDCGAKALPGGLFAQLGGTPSASYAPGTVAYSLLTSVNTPTSSTPPTFSPTGQGTEALGCTLVPGSTAGQTTCPVNAVGGVVSGAFINYLNASGNNVTFTTTNPASVTARSVDPSSRDQHRHRRDQHRHPAVPVARPGVADPAGLPARSPSTGAPSAWSGTGRTRPASRRVPVTTSSR